MASGRGAAASESLERPALCRFAYASETAAQRPITDEVQAASRSSWPKPLGTYGASGNSQTRDRARCHHGHRRAQPREVVPWVHHLEDQTHRVEVVLGEQRGSAVGVARRCGVEDGAVLLGAVLPLSAVPATVPFGVVEQLGDLGAHA